ncbi:MAG TPA: hypothetical protein VMS38_19535 [Pseudorhodoferax sp.]|nr:hypothetical protein [Pseudorhodoferax sp.]
MAYAAYQEFSHPAAPARVQPAQVLDITVPLANADAVRRALRACGEAGILGCEPLLRPRAACADSLPRVRFSVLLPAACLDQVSALVLACTQDGEFGAVMSWRAHLARRGLPHGG